MLGKAPSNKHKSSQDYVHVDVCENWLATHVSPGDAFYRFANDSRGIGQLINLCRQRGVSKIYMKAAGEHGARARHALTVAGLSVTAADPLRARIFADADRSRNARRWSTISLAGASIALVAAGLFALQWNRAEQTVELASEATRGWMSGATQKAEGAPGAIASFLAEAAKTLVGSNRGDPADQRDSPVSHGRLGDARPASGDRAAVSQSQGDLAIIKALSDAGDGGGRNLGQARRAQDGPAAPLQSFRDSMAASKALSDADPGDKSRRRELAAAEQKLGDAQRAQGDLAAAMQSYRDSFALNKVLSAADPGDAGLRRDLAAGYEKLGDVALAQGDHPAALRSFRDDVASSKALADAAPGDAGRRRRFGGGLRKTRRRSACPGRSGGGGAVVRRELRPPEGAGGRGAWRRRPATRPGGRLRKTRRRPACPRRSGGGAILPRRLRDPRGVVGGRSRRRRAAARHDRDMFETVDRGAAERPRLFVEGARDRQATRGRRPINIARQSLRR